ncbi:MAG: hypothetical protein WBW03_19140 [Silvibacterium sp.]
MIPQSNMDVMSKSTKTGAGKTGRPIGFDEAGSPGSGDLTILPVEALESGIICLSARLHDVCQERLYVYARKR